MFLENTSQWGPSYSLWPATGQMNGGNASEHIDVLRPDFAATLGNWTERGVAFARQRLEGRAPRVMVDLEQAGFDRFLYWATALGQLPNGSFARGPQYRAADAELAASGLTSMASAYSAALGDDPRYEFGFYNGPGLGGTDVAACLAGQFPLEALYGRFANSSGWWPAALRGAVTYLCPECYPGASYAMRWPAMVAYGLARYAYDYAHAVGSAAVRANLRDAGRLRPVLKSTFEVKPPLCPSDDCNVPFPYMDETSFTAQLCGLRDAGIRRVLVWNYYGVPDTAARASTASAELQKACCLDSLGALDRARWLGLGARGGALVEVADLDAPPPRAALVAKLKARFTDELRIVQSVFQVDAAGAEAVCAGVRPARRALAGALSDD
eukprot:g3417.t1